MLSNFQDVALSLMCDVYLDDFPSTSKEPNTQDCLQWIDERFALKNIYIFDMEYIIECISV